MSEIETIEMLNKLPSEQLLQVYNNLRDECQTLQAGLNEAKNEIMDTNDTLATIESYTKTEIDQDLLVPLSDSVFVPGKVASNDKVLLDLGTSYFAEITTDVAATIIKSRLEKIVERQKSLQNALEIKVTQVQTISEILTQRGQ